MPLPPLGLPTRRELVTDPDVSRLVGGAGPPSYVAAVRGGPVPSGSPDGIPVGPTRYPRRSRWSRSSRTNPRPARTIGLPSSRSAASARSRAGRANRRNSRCGRRRHSAASAPTGRRALHTRRSRCRWAERRIDSCSHRGPSFLAPACITRMHASKLCESGARSGGEKDVEITNGFTAFVNVRKQDFNVRCIYNHPTDVLRGTRQVVVQEEM